MAVRRIEVSVPELPEVEIMVRNLARWVQDAVVVDVDLHDPALLGAGAGVDALVGARVIAVARRAKLALIGTSTGVLSLHFRMTGKVVRSISSAHAAPRLTLSFDNGERVSFVDRRRLGQAQWVPGAEIDEVADALGAGPEPYPDVRTGDWWRERLAGLRGPIKPALMRPERVAGIGNILASEICHRAAIDPTRPVPAVEDEEWARLAQVVVPLIDATIQQESGDEIAYLNDGGRIEDTVFEVYGREGSPCHTCGEPIERFKQSGRSTFWCPGCVSNARGSGG